MFATVTCLAISGVPVPPKAVAPPAIGNTRLSPELTADGQAKLRHDGPTPLEAGLLLLNAVLLDPEAFMVLADIDRAEARVKAGGGGRVRFNVEIEDDTFRGRMEAAAAVLNLFKDSFSR